MSNPLAVTARKLHVITVQQGVKASTKVTEMMALTCRCPSLSPMGVMPPLAVALSLLEVDVRLEGRLSRGARAALAEVSVSAAVLLGIRQPRKALQALGTPPGPLMPRHITNVSDGHRHCQRLDFCPALWVNIGDVSASHAVKSFAVSGLGREPAQVARPHVFFPNTLNQSVLRGGRLDLKPSLEAPTKRLDGVYCPRLRTQPVCWNRLNFASLLLRRKLCQAIYRSLKPCSHLTPLNLGQLSGPRSELAVNRLVSFRAF